MELPLYDKVHGVVDTEDPATHQCVAREFDEGTFLRLLFYSQRSGCRG